MVIGKLVSAFVVRIERVEELLGSPIRVVAVPPAIVV